MPENFNPRTPCGVRPDVLVDYMDGSKISIHAPLAGCDVHVSARFCRRPDFNPRTPCGVRQASAKSVQKIRRFQSTHPLRGATLQAHRRTRRPQNFNPRTPCGVRLASSDTEYGLLVISIHAPLAGCDRPCNTFRYARLHFNPRTPCGVRQILLQVPYFRLTFQSTHPLRGATRNIRDSKNDMTISIHAPLAGCDSWRYNYFDYFSISIHAPLAGCDYDRHADDHRHRHFNPRTPCGVRPAPVHLLANYAGISIHAPLAGCDARGKIFAFCRSQFQSTHPLRGATLHDRRERERLHHFNPRTPCGVRRGRCSPSW